MYSQDITREASKLSLDNYLKTKAVISLLGGCNTKSLTPAQKLQQRLCQKKMHTTMAHIQLSKCKNLACSEKTMLNMLGPKILMGGDTDLHEAEFAGESSYKKALQIYTKAIDDLKDGKTLTGKFEKYRHANHCSATQIERLFISVGSDFDNFKELLKRELKSTSTIHFNTVHAFLQHVILCS